MTSLETAPPTLISARNVSLAYGVYDYDVCDYLTIFSASDTIGVNNNYANFICMFKHGYSVFFQIALFCSEQPDDIIYF